MKRTHIAPALSQFPQEYHSLLRSAQVYDSSCSPDARVWFLDTEGGLFLKSASVGTLKAEAEMTRYFHRKGLSAEVLSYQSRERDWLLTTRIPGEDCTHPNYLSDPKHLCDTTAELLRRLHDAPHEDCPVTGCNDFYLTTAEAGYRAGRFDADLFPEGWGFPSPEAAHREMEENARHLRPNALLHGDYCLPNVMLDNWRFAGFIDLGRAGVGDRHIDIFWGLWTLNYNLKTNMFYDRFLDVYGRDRVQPELLRTVAALECFL